MVIDKELIKIINCSSTHKVISTVNPDGTPHVVFKNSIYVNREGNIIVCEIIENSVTNRNMVNSIWFNKKISFNFLSEDNRSYLIRGVPMRAIISGKEFEKYYQYINDLYGNIDLSTVWIVCPEFINEETLEKRRIEEMNKHKIINHLDRLLIN